MNDDDADKHMQPELDRIRADHERFLRLVAQAPEPSEEQKRAIREANSPEGWQRAMDDVLLETGLRPQPRPREKGGVMRTFGIWVFGILASAIVGGIAGSRFEATSTSGTMVILGMLAGIFMLACLRLWSVRRVKFQTETLPRRRSRALQRNHEGEEAYCSFREALAALLVRRGWTYFVQAWWGPKATVSVQGPDDAALCYYPWHSKQTDTRGS